MTRLDMDDRTLLGRAQPPAVPDTVIASTPVGSTTIGRINRLLAALIFGAVMFLAGVVCTTTVLPGGLA
jgi:hypothetical protein